MRAIILAGGMGSRLRPLTDTIPKPLLPIQGRPIVEHAIVHLKRFGITDIVLSIGYKAEAILNYFGEGVSLGVHITYVVEDEPLGTGGAIAKALDGDMAATVILWGDNLMDLDYAQLLATFAAYQTPVTMVLTPREDVEHFGVAALDSHTVVSFVEKPLRHLAPSNLINAGAIILKPQRLSILPPGASSIERDFYEKLSPGEITAYIHRGQWYPTDTLEKYNYANAHFKVRE